MQVSGPHARTGEVTPLGAAHPLDGLGNRTDRRSRPVTESERNPPEPREPILAREEASRRAALLSDLHGALAAQGVNSTVVRRRRLVLEGAGTKCAPSGPTDPQLYIFTPCETNIVTTNGRTYFLSGRRACPADDLAQAMRTLQLVGLIDTPDQHASDLARRQEAAARG